MILYCSDILFPKTQKNNNKRVFLFLLSISPFLLSRSILNLKHSLGKENHIKLKKSLTGIEGLSEFPMHTYNLDFPSTKKERKKGEKSLLVHRKPLLEGANYVLENRD